MSIRIVTDSAADLPPHVAQKLHISVVPALVQFGQESFRDRVDLSTTEFYTRMAKSQALPTTAAPPSGFFATEYERLTQAGHDVVSVHVGAGLSGIFNSARVAAADFGDRVRLVDSTNLSLAIGWVAIEAARAAQRGLSLDEVVAAGERAAPRVRLWAALDTLEYAYRGGRVSAPAAWIGSLLHVKPILDFRNSAVQVTDRTRSMRNAVNRLLEIVQAAGPIQEIGVIHAAAPELGAEVQRRVRALYPAVDVSLVETGPAVGVHCGPGAVGISTLLAT